jgi:DNA/RNA non-specific endonuclease
MKTTALIPKTFRLLLSVWLLSFSAHRLHAQFNNFPVSCNPFIVRDLSTDAPPWQWSNFYNSSTFLNLNLLLKDNKQGGDIDVFVRIKLERVGITISNPTDFVASKPIRLSFGSLKSLSGIDISENFLPQNLVLSGLEDSFVRQGGTLPDGLWTIKVTAYEFDGSRGYRQVSNEGIGQLMVFYGQPPMLLAPANTSEIDNSFSPNVLFNWLPKATATIGGLSNIAYEFELWELGDNEDPNEVALGKTPIFTKTVSSPMMLYDAHQQPPLKTGFHYAWRVRVVDATGNNAYENKGNSEVWSFRYGIRCSDTGNLQIKLLGGRTYRLTWDYAKNANSYEINWREKGTSNWQIENSHYSNFDIKLEESIAYEFRVRAVCQSGETGSWSEVLEWQKDGETRSKSSAARMSVGTESSGGTGTTTTSTPEEDLNKVLNPLGNTVTSGDTNPAKANELLKKPDDNITRCSSSVKTTTASCEDDKSVGYTGGVSLPSPAIGTKLYLNGYEIVLTSGDDKKGEGLLFFPYLMKRIPVEWTTKIDIRQGETAEYGCIVGANDKVQVQGSNAGALSDDLNRQFTALAAWLNEPGSFTGTFGAALEAAKKKTKELLDKLDRGEKISPADFKGYNSICKAIDKGMDTWLKDIDKVYGNPASNPEVAQIYNDLVQYRNDLKNEMNCDKSSFLPTKKDFNEAYNTVYYASLRDDFRNPESSYKETIFAFLTTCKLENTKPTIEKITGTIADLEKINLIATKDPNGKYFSVDYEYFVSHNGQSRAYFNTLKLNGAPLGIKIKDVQYYWNGVNAYTNVTKWTNNLPEFGTDNAPLKVVTNPDIYYYYVYYPNGDCAFEKRTIDGKAKSSVQFSECRIQSSTDAPKKPDGKEIVCPALPTVLNAENLINKFFHNDYFAHCLSILTIEERKTLLKEILNNWIVTECLQNIDDPTHKIGNCYEPLCKNIITSTPPSQQVELLNFFKIEKTKDGSKLLLEPLLTNLDYGTFDIVLKSLADWIIKEYPPQTGRNFNIENYLSDYIDKSRDPIDATKRDKSKAISFSANFVKGNFYNGVLTLTREGLRDAEVGELTPDVSIKVTDPYSYVLVYFEEEIPNQPFKKGEYYTIPALQAYLLFNTDRRGFYEKTAVISLEVGLCFLGVGEMTAAYRLYRAGRTIYGTYLMTKATLDLGMGLTDIYIQNSLAEEWKKTEEGQKKLEKWNTINKWYMISSLSASAIDLAITKVAIGKSIDNEDELNRLYNEASGGVRAGRKYVKGLTDAHYDKIDEIMDSRAKALLNEIEDNPSIIRVGAVDEIEALAKTKKWRLKPNDTYTDNGYTFKTDKYGRIESVDGNLKLDGVERHPDGPNVGEGDGKLPNDVGGHLIGRQYGGAGNATNVVAMEKTVNAYSNVGKFGQHEIRWRRLLTQNPPSNIQLKIEVIYNPNNFTIRPDSFEVTEIINGSTRNFTIPNY